MITDHPYVTGPDGRCRYRVQYRDNMSGSSGWEWCGQTEDNHISPNDGFTETQRNSPAARAWRETERQKEAIRNQPPDRVSPEWAARNAKHLPKIKAQNRRDEIKLRRLQRNIDRKARQIKAIEALVEDEGNSDDRS